MSSALEGENGSSANDSIDGMDKQAMNDTNKIPPSKAERIDHGNNVMSGCEDKLETESASTFTGIESITDIQTSTDSSMAVKDRADDVEMDTDNDVDEKALDDEVNGSKTDNDQGHITHKNNDSIMHDEELTEGVEKNEVTKTNKNGEKTKGTKTIEINQEERESLKESSETLDLQKEGAKEKEHDKILDSSAGESEFSKFLTQVPAELDGSIVDGDTGIVINDQDIIKAEDVLGRGKRSRTPKTDSIYTSNIDDDPDYHPNDEYSDSDRTKKYIRDSKAKQSQQLASASIQIASTPMKKPKYPHLDVKALEFPGEFGWHREIVVRNTFNDNKKRPADVYYKPPTGKKLRSMVEVSAYLREKKIKDLTENNFSFIKTPISDPPFETVRNAGKSTFYSKKKPEIMIEKDSDEPAIPFTGSPSKVKISPRGKKRKLSMSYSKTTTKPETRSGDTTNKEGKENKGIPFLPEMQLSIKTEPIDPDEENEREKEKEATFPECPPTLEETRVSPSTSPLRKKSKATARKSTTQKSFKLPVASPDGKLDPLCNLNCPGLAGQHPTLQCSVCQCMFHPKCVNVTKAAQSFLCLRCVSRTCPQGSGPSHQVNTSKVMIPSTSSTASKSSLIPLNTFIANAVTASSISSVIPTTTVSDQVVIKKEPVEHDNASNHSFGTGVSSNVLGNVRNFLERKADINQNQTVNQYPLIKEGLKKPSLPKVSNAMVFSPLLGQSAPIRTTLPLSNVPAPVIFNSIPVVQPPLIALPGSLVQDFHKPAPTQKLSISSPVTLLQPPRLTAAPVQQPETPTLPEVNGLKSIDPSQNKQGQLLTLPPVVIKRLNLTQPVSLKINNTHVTVPPSSFLRTAQGLKLFLPKNTFPVSTGETAKLSVTVTNDKTLSLDTGMSDQSGQLPTIVPNSSRTLTEEPRKSRRFQSDIIPTNCFVQCLYGGFDCMMEVFRYLSIRDLFSAASVCKTWQRLVMHPCLWKEVKFRNMKVLDWEKAARYLSRRAVEILDLRGLRHQEERSKTWNQLISNIHLFTCVHTVYFGTVPGSVLEALCEKMHQLEVLSAEWISEFTDDMMKTDPTKLDIGKFSSLTNLRELYLRGTAGLNLPAFSFSGGLSELKTLKHLKTLSLTTLKEFGTDTELEFLPLLPQLKQLDVGDCTSWTKQTYSIIGKLTQLQSLHLECGESGYDTGLAEALINLQQLVRLELIQFLISEDLHETLAMLEKLTSFKVWPDTSGQPAAQVNSTALLTVKKLKFLRHFEWGVLRNNDSSLILDGDDTSKQKSENNQEWIPFLPDQICGSQGESHTEYISLIKFKEKLSKLLPTTFINVLSVQSLMKIEEES